jgi:hypothetical protein
LPSLFPRSFLFAAAPCFLPVKGGAVPPGTNHTPLDFRFRMSPETSNQPKIVCLKIDRLVWKLFCRYQSVTRPDGSYRIRLIWNAAHLVRRGEVVKIRLIL